MAAPGSGALPGGFPGLWTPQAGPFQVPATRPGFTNLMGGAPALGAATPLGAQAPAPGGGGSASFNPAGGVYMDIDTYLAYAQQQYTNHYFSTLRQMYPPEVAMKQAQECVEKLKANGFFDQLKSQYQASLAATGSAYVSQKPQELPATTTSPAAPNTPTPLPRGGQTPQDLQKAAAQQGRVTFSLKVKKIRGGQPDAPGSPHAPAAVPAAGPGPTGGAPGGVCSPTGAPPPLPSSPSPYAGAGVAGSPGGCASAAGAGATPASAGASASVPPWAAASASAAIPPSALPSYGAYYQQMLQAQHQQQALRHQQMLYSQQAQQMHSHPSMAPGGLPQGQAATYPSNVYNPAAAGFPGAPPGASPMGSGGLQQVPAPPPIPPYTGGAPLAPAAPHAAGSIESAVQAAAKAAAAAVEAKHRNIQGLRGAGAAGVDPVASARDQALKRAAEITKDIEERRKQQLLSTQAFSIWLQKVHSIHLAGEKGLDWRRAVNLYSQKMTNAYRQGLLGGRDWTAQPVPSEEEIRGEVAKLDLLNQMTRDRHSPDADAADRDRDVGGSRTARREGERARGSRSRSRSPPYGGASHFARNGDRSLSAYRHRTSSPRSGDGWRGRSEERLDDDRSPSESAARARRGEEDFISLSDKWSDRGAGGKARAKARQVQLQWRGTRAERASASADRKDAASMLIKCTPQEEQKRLQRMNRFGPNARSGPAASAKDSVYKVSWMEGSASPSSAAGLSWQQKLEIAKSTEKIVGTSTALEKNYLRLTNAPDPATVRPPEVLRRSFELILRKHREGASWRYVEEQFRSMRQDLTVQGVKDDFSRKVYETNGRLALSYHDLGQFNQCQTQLRDLYKRLQVPEDDPDRLEYLCYRLVYMALQGMRLDVLRVMSEMTTAERRNSNVVYAMKVRRALADGNFRRYFYLATIGPHQTKHLCEIFEPRVRMLALVTMAKASRALQPRKVQEELNFGDLEETLAFLRREEAVFTPDGKVDSKRSLPNFEKSSLLSKKVKAMG